MKNNKLLRLLTMFISILMSTYIVVELNNVLYKEIADGIVKYLSEKKQIDMVYIIYTIIMVLVWLLSYYIVSSVILAINSIVADSNSKIIFMKVSDSYIKNKDITDLKLPICSTKSSVGYDFFSPVDCIVEPNSDVMIWSDIKVKFPDNVCLELNVRSSMGKHHVMLANTQGWIESDYFGNQDNDGNIGFMLYNYGKEPYVIKAGDAIGQGKFSNFLKASNCNTTYKRKGGFGSTSK